MDSIVEPSTNGEEIDSSQEVAGKFVKALREAAHILTATKEAFDDVALTVKPFVDWLWASGVRPIRNNRYGSFMFNRLANMLAVIGFIGADGQRRGGMVQKFRKNSSIVNVTAREDKS